MQRERSLMAMGVIRRRELTGNPDSLKREPDVP